MNLRKSKIKVIMKRKKNTNKKISNNEPLERRTEFLWNQKQILPRNQMKMTLGSKDRESVKDVLILDILMFL